MNRISSLFLSFLVMNLASLVQAGNTDQAVLVEHKQQETVAEQSTSYVDTIKHSIQAASSYVQQKTKNLFSAENQASTILSWGILKFFQLFYQAHRLKDGVRVAVVEQSPPIMAAVNKMEFSHNAVYRYQSEGLMCRAYAEPSSGKIFMGSELLQTSSSQEIEFVTGHEIAHVQNRHDVYCMLGSGIVLGGLVVFPVVIEKLIEKLEDKKYCSKNYSAISKVITVLKKINTLYTNNPLIGFLILRTLSAAISRSTEKEADITSAQKTGQAAGGISILETSIKKHADIRASRSWFYYLNPLNLFDKIDYTLFPSHHSHQERIEYLKPFVQQPS